MANVIQVVPDGNICATLGICSTNEDSKCIFLDKGRHFQKNCGSGFDCRRYPNWELAVKHWGLTVEHGGEVFEIHKCPPCLKETVKENE